jgi:hypothetical protein
MALIFMLLITGCAQDNTEVVEKLAAIEGKLAAIEGKLAEEEEKRVIVEYMTVSGEAKDGSLKRRVNKYLAKGWEPFGGPFNRNTRDFQAMVKYADSDEQPAASPE